MCRTDLLVQNFIILILLGEIEVLIQLETDISLDIQDEDEVLTEISDYSRTQKSELSVTNL